jgi:hypothetical protein
VVHLAVFNLHSDDRVGRGRRSQWFSGDQDLGLATLSRKRRLRAIIWRLYLARIDLKLGVLQRRISPPVSTHKCITCRG